MGAILFDELKLPALVKTPGGQPSTNEEALEAIAEQHELPRMILDYRSLAKLRSTYTEKLADARRQSEVIRGEGEGERNKTFAEAFQQDPEFFAFYRSMQAYAKSLSSSGTTLVLRPDSDFFKYLGMDKATPAPPQ